MASTITRNIAGQLAGLAVLASMLTAATASAGPVTRSKGNGAYMQVYGTDSSGCIRFWLYVSRGGTAQAPETYMYYDVYNQCASEWMAYGYGLVANPELKTTKKGATLTLEGRSSVDFYAQGASGSFDVTVTADGLYSSSYSGHSRTEFGGHVYQSHGSWTSASATATGSMLGFTFDRASASFGEGHDKFMDIDRGQN